MGVQPIIINSSLLSAQLRERAYWTNIPNISQPKDKGIELQSILTSGFTDRKKSRALLVSDSRPLTTKSKMLRRYRTGFTTLIWEEEEGNDETIRYFNQTELERLQTVPEGYTKCLTRNEAANVLGDSWTVDVIAHIFSNLKGVQAMIKCKQAMENPTCGKVCCCLECEERESCEEVCTELSPDCEDAFNEERALATMQTEAAAIIKGIANLTLQKKQIEEQEKEMRVQLMAAMEKYGVKSFENEDVKFTYVAATTRTTIDSTKLKKDLPDIAAKYSKTSNVSASVKITVRG